MTEDVGLLTASPARSRSKLYLAIGAAVVIIIAVSITAAILATRSTDRVKQLQEKLSAEQISGECAHISRILNNLNSFKLTSGN